MTKLALNATLFAGIPRLVVISLDDLINDNDALAVPTTAIPSPPAS
jgi:hypothetical protein